jgi:mannosyltransferase OCH1-like enzyme
MINKILLQTSINKPTRDHISNLMKMAPGWDYVHFNDAEILDFFVNNPIQGFEKIKQRFYEIPRGEHRADLFRYYYLFINGGFFIDFDFELTYDINQIVKSFELVSAEITVSDPSVQSDTKRSRVFNGYMYANKKNQIIYQALSHLYNINIRYLGPLSGEWSSEYHIVCEALHAIIKSQKDQSGIKLYTITDSQTDGSKIFDGSTVLGIHHAVAKT